MLYLTRKPGEQIYLDGAFGRVVIELATSSSNRAGIGIDAPADVSIIRAELDSTSETAAPTEGGRA